MRYERTESRDFLDLLDSYRYMNDSLFFDLMEMDGRWDYANGWVRLNVPEEEWRVRSSVPFPENNTIGASH